MILGRPSNLWFGAATAIWNVFYLVGGSQYNISLDVYAGVNVVLGAVIALIANQPPTVNPGDTITVKTPSGQPDRTITA